MTATQLKPEAAGAVGRYWESVWAVVGMELRQRLRSRGWYIMLGLWFLIIGVVTALTWWSWQAQVNMNRDLDPLAGSAEPGTLIFEIVLAFVLLFALLVAPALSANAVNGDRAAGTLAIMQVTLLRPGQILWGKFIASWIASLAFLVASIPFIVFAIVQGGLGFLQIMISLLMLSLEVGLVCAMGVGISALANRPLFSIVVTYLVVAALTVGTLIAFGLGAALSTGTVQANQAFYKGMEMAPGEDPEMYPPAPKPKDITDENADYACFGPLEAQPVTRTERVAWLLSLNPFVVVADAIPYPQRASENRDYYATGLFENISQGARFAQAGPEATYQCAGGKVAPSYVEQTTPLWPLGLGLQLVLAAGILVFGWRALWTPAGKLPRGTRIA